MVSSVLERVLSSVLKQHTRSRFENDKMINDKFHRDQVYVPLVVGSKVGGGGLSHVSGPLAHALLVVSMVHDDA